MAELRRAIIILAKSTGWGWADINDMDEDDFWATLQEARTIDNEIAEAMKR